VVSNKERFAVFVALALICGSALSACGSASKPQSAPTTTKSVRQPHPIASQRVIANDGAKDDYFGGDYWYNTFENPVAPVYYASPGESSISADGNFAVVGAPGHAAGGITGAGAAYVYERANGKWAQVAELTPAVPQKYSAFGWAVAISDDGSTVVAGSPYHSSAGKAGDGAAYVFHNVAGKWAQSAQLEPGDGAAYDSFGWSLAISGASAPYSVLVGAPSHEVGSSPNAGVAYAFVGSGAGWTLRSEIASPDAAAEGEFATAVALSGDGSTALLTKFDHVDSKKVHRYGSLYVYKTTDGWVSAKVVRSFQDPNRNADDSLDAYGTDVGLAADGRTAMVAAPDVFVGKVPGAGVTYVYTTGSDWQNAADTHTSTIAQPKPQSFGYYGSTVEVDATGASAIVGADGIGTNGQGGVFLLQPAGAANASRWSATSVKQRLIPSPDAAGPGRLGTDIGFSGDGKTILATAPFETVAGKEHQGAAYFFTVK
jgi:hypothetical protein